jgi:subtilisin family serine protease
MLFCMIPTLSMNVEAKPQQARYVPGEVIIGLKDASIEEFRPFISGLGATVKREILGLHAVVVKVTPGTEESLMQSMRGRPEVAFVERNGIYNAAFIPNDTNWPLQWNMPMIKANASWDTYRGSTEVVIAIIDTGIDYNHPDLAANYKSGGYDWVNNDPNPMDDNSHGTHCAGIAAAVLNNALGVAGVAQVKVWTEKVLDNTGSGSWDDAASGVIHATDKGVNVISMSMGGYSYSNLLDNACTYAWNRGVVLVAAAGNDQRSLDTYPFYPASFSTVIAVSATKSTDIFDTDYSNYGSKIEVSAPGTSIYSTVPNATYGYKTGTSMACPHVAGLVALIWSYKPQLTNGQVRSALQTSVDDKGAVGKDIYYGYGRINCAKIISSPEKYQYKFTISGYGDRVYVNVTSKPGGTLINGKVNLTSPNAAYPAPVLGWASGNNFYMTFDYRTTAGAFELGFLVGTISTASGNLYRTTDGTTWVGPTAVSLVSFAETTEESEQLNTAGEVETTAIQYVEGFNPAQTLSTLYTYTDASWYALQYTPSISYALKKVELMAGLGTGPFVVQLRADNGSGYPSSTVLRQVTFNLANTSGTWQGAEFATSYMVNAGTPYWIVFQPVKNSRASVATSGTNVIHCWDYFGDGTGDWDYKAASYPWMAKFYREVQPNFKYHFTVSPFIDKAYVNITSQSGGTLIYGLANVTANIVNYPAPILGWAVGNNFYMPFDYRTVIGSGAFELGFLIGTVSTASGNLYRTFDGVSVDGPTAVTLVAFAESVKEATKLISATP